ncbi:MAG: hypothetical protein R2706_21035 [Acidimicrobiales bacterium]
MSDFTPTNDFPEFVDDDDTVVSSSAKSRDAAVQRRRKLLLRWLVLGAGLGLVAAGFSPLRTVIAIAISYLLLTIGFGIIGAFARPIPEAPPAGELRRVKLTYRCVTCGAELRMTLANDQMPAPPRHCMDEMELTTSVDDIL